MRRSTTTALRVVLALSLAGSVFVQVVMVPLLAIDFEEADPSQAAWQIPFALNLILIVAAGQAFAVCIWRLATMAGEGTVFTTRAFRYVDAMIAAAVAAALLIFLLGFVLAPGDAVAPGLVLLVGGAGLVAAGIALTVLVLRALLAQAIRRDSEASELQAELDEVI